MCSRLALLFSPHTLTFLMLDRLDERARSDPPCAHECGRNMCGYSGLIQRDERKPLWEPAFSCAAYISRPALDLGRVWKVGISKGPF